jgi:hypothetical protein
MYSFYRNWGWNGCKKDWGIGFECFEAGEVCGKKNDGQKTKKNGEKWRELGVFERLKAGEMSKAMGLR